MNIFKLVGSIFIDTDAAESSLSKTDKKASNVGDALKKIGSTAAKVGAGVATAAGTMVAGITKFATETATTMDTIDKMSQKVGLSREAYQEWDYVLSQNGMDIESMQAGIRTLTDDISAVTAAGDTAGTAFEALGLTYEDLAGLSREDIFALTISRLQEMDDETQKAALAQDLFGRSGTELIPLLNQTADSTDALRQKAHDLGMVMSDESVDAGVRLNDTIDTLKRTFSAMASGLGSAVMPIVNQFAQMLIDYAPTIQGIFTQLTPIVTALFDELLPPIMELMQTLLPVVMDLIKALLPPIATLMQTLLPVLVDIIKGIAPILRPIVTLLSQGLTVAFKVLNPILTTFGNIFKEVFNAIPTVAKGALNMLISFLNAAIDGANTLLIPLRAIIMAVGDLFGANWSMSDVSIPHIPMLAKGGMVDGSGTAIVGERGTELVDLPRGASVIPLEDGGLDGLNRKVDELIGVVRQIIGTGVYLDGGALVGQIAPDMDMALGRLAVKNGRNV